MAVVVGVAEHVHYLRDEKGEWVERFKRATNRAVSLGSHAILTHIFKTLPYVTN